MRIAFGTPVLLLSLLTVLDLSRSVEHAFATAFLFTGQRPILQTVYEQMFIAPVEIGSICEFNARTSP